jgi:hypothetical protein
MRSRDGSKGENKGNQGGAGGDSIGKKSDGYIARGQSLTHDAGADDGG